MYANLVDLLDELILYLNSEAHSQTALFVCGDFNFVVSREAFRKTVHAKGFEIHLGKQERGKCIDFVLIRGVNVNVTSLEPKSPSDSTEASELLPTKGEVPLSEKEEIGSIIKKEVGLSPASDPTVVIEDRLGLPESHSLS